MIGSWQSSFAESPIEPQQVYNWTKHLRGNGLFQLLKDRRVVQKTIHQLSEDGMHLRAEYENFNKGEHTTDTIFHFDRKE